MTIDVEKIIKKAIASWEYGLGGAEEGIEEFKENEDFGELIYSLIEAHEIISHTSVGSIYRTLMESSDLSAKYEKEFIALWGRAKKIKFAAVEEINNFIGRKKKE